MNKNVKDASVKSMILGGIANNIRLQQLDNASIQFYRSSYYGLFFEV